MDTNGKTIVVKDDKGRSVTCDLLFTFDSDETGKHYVVYTDNAKDALGNTQVYASILAENGKLEVIETRREWDTIQTILDTLQEEARARSLEGLSEEEICEALMRKLEGNGEHEPEPEPEPKRTRPYTLDDLNNDVDELNAYMRKVLSESPENKS